MIPEKFEELSGKQFISLSGILYKGGDQLQCEIRALRILAGLSRFRMRILNPDFVARCLEYINWVFDGKRTVNQLLPIYRGYYGPISDFDNLKMGEFHFSEIFYRDIIRAAVSEEENTGALNNLVAILYRKSKPDYDKKKNPDGDIRKNFNSNEVEFYAGKISGWPAAVKHAIFLWYDACRQELIRNNPLVFSEPSMAFESMFDTGLYGIMRSLAGDKLGPVSEIEDMYVHTAMMEIGLMREEEKRVEEQLNKN